MSNAYLDNSLASWALNFDDRIACLHDFEKHLVTVVARRFGLLVSAIRVLFGVYHDRLTCINFLRV